MKMAKSQKEAAGSKRGIFKVMSNYWELYLLLLPVLIWFVVFSYVPMGGLIIAFQKYSPIKGIIDSEWVGWANFTKMLSTPSFNIAFKNTIIVSVLNLLIVFPVPIVFAILLNELPWLRYSSIRTELFPLIANGQILSFQELKLIFLYSVWNSP